MANTRRFLILGVVFIVAGTAGLTAMEHLQERRTVGTRKTSGTSGMPMMNGGMMSREEMKRMMQTMMSDRLPPGIKTEDLPESGGPGAGLLTRYCQQCHNLPSPAMHTTNEWPRVASRMFQRMEMMSGQGGMMRGMMDIRSPTVDEQKTLLAYLQHNALRSADLKALGAGNAPGLDLFRRTCSQCHALPDPKLHTAGEWPAVVERMREHMKSMNKTVITDRERDQIVVFLAGKSTP